MKKFITPAIIAIALVPVLAGAQVTTISGSSITSVGSVIDLVRYILNLLFIIFGILAVFFFLYAAILFLTAGGNEDNKKKASGYLKWGIVAIIVAIISYTIIPIVQSFLNQG